MWFSCDAHQYGNLTVNKYNSKINNTRAVWKIRGFALLLRVGTLWRWGDGLFFEVPPTSRKRAADRWSLPNFLPRSSLFMVGEAQKLHGARSGLYGGCSNAVPPIHFFKAEQRIQFRSRPMRFMGFSNHENGALRQEISKWCGWSVVRSASLAKGGTLKKRPSSHLGKVPTRSNKMSPRTLPTALVYFRAICRACSLKFIDVSRSSLSPLSGIWFADSP
jgi:hypothetical protein